ncbi:hypothetical protein C0989_008857 [Termitomyces sp. Mn162]|nr:hypothetical protein C0989_008857 [Termitomyces sp. Mn162]
MAPLTHAIHSEEDSEDATLGCYLYPALFLVGFLKAKEKLRKANSLKKYTNSKIMDFKEFRREFRLYVASCSGASHIADFGIYKSLLDDKLPGLHLVTEVKTPVAFPAALFIDLSPRLLSAVAKQDDYNMEETDMERIKGWAIQFKWPKHNQNFGNKDYET